MTGDDSSVDGHSFGRALLRAALAYLAIGPVTLFVLDWLLLPLLFLDGWDSFSLAMSVGEYVALFFAGLWGIPIVVPVVGVLRSRTNHRKTWGAVSAALSLEIVGFVLSPALAFSMAAVGVLLAGAVYGYVASLIIPPRRSR